MKRFSLAKRAGFSAVELAWPYEHSVAEFGDAVAGSGLDLVLINTPPGGAGELGLAAVPKRETEFLDGLKMAIEYAKAGKCGMIHIMAGLLPEGEISKEVRENYRQVFVKNLQTASAWVHKIQKGLSQKWEIEII